jgi:hypothetical protein
LINLLGITAMSLEIRGKFAQDFAMATLGDVKDPGSLQVTKGRDVLMPFLF